MNRRSFLKVFGVMAAAPSLLVKEAAFTPRLDPNVISTGIKALDSTMLGGGLQRGEIFSIIGYTGVGKSIMTKTVALNAATQGTVALIQDHLPLAAQGKEENCNGNLSIFENYDLKNIEYLFDNYDIVVIDRDMLTEENNQLMIDANRFLSKYTSRLIITLPALRQCIDRNSPMAAPIEFIPAHRAAWMSNYMARIDIKNNVDQAMYDRCKISHMKDFLHKIIYPIKAVRYRPRTVKMIKNRYDERKVWAPIWIDQNHTFTDKYFDYEKTQQANPDISLFQYERQPHSSQG